MIEIASAKGAAASTAAFTAAATVRRFSRLLGSRSLYFGHTTTLPRRSLQGRQRDRARLGQARPIIHRNGKSRGPGSAPPDGIPVIEQAGVNRILAQE